MQFYWFWFKSALIIIALTYVCEAAYDATEGAVQSTFSDFDPFCWGRGWNCICGAIDYNRYVKSVIERSNTNVHKAVKGLVWATECGNIPRENIIKHSIDGDKWNLLEQLFSHDRFRGCHCDDESFNAAKKRNAEWIRFYLKRCSGNKEKYFVRLIDKHDFQDFFHRHHWEHWHELKKFVYSDNFKKILVERVFKSDIQKPIVYNAINEFFPNPLLRVSREFVTEMRYMRFAPNAKQLLLLALSTDYKALITLSEYQPFLNDFVNSLSEEQINEAISMSLDRFHTDSPIYTGKFYSWSEKSEKYEDIIRSKGQIKVNFGLLDHMCLNPATTRNVINAFVLHRKEWLAIKERLKVEGWHVYVEDFERVINYKEKIKQWMGNHIDSGLVFDYNNFIRHFGIPEIEQWALDKVMKLYDSPTLKPSQFEDKSMSFQLIVQMLEEDAVKQFLNEHLKKHKKCSKNLMFLMNYFDSIQLRNAIDLLDKMTLKAIMELGQTKGEACNQLASLILKHGFVYNKLSDKWLQMYLNLVPSPKLKALDRFIGASNYEATNAWVTWIKANYQLLSEEDIDEINRSNILNHAYFVHQQHYRTYGALTEISIRSRSIFQELLQLKHAAKFTYEFRGENELFALGDSREMKNLIEYHQEDLSGSALVLYKGGRELTKIREYDETKALSSDLQQLSKALQSGKYSEAQDLYQKAELKAANMKPLFVPEEEPMTTVRIAFRNACTDGNIQKYDEIRKRWVLGRDDECVQYAMHNSHWPLVTHLVQKQVGIDQRAKWKPELWKKLLKAALKNKQWDVVKVIRKNGPKRLGWTHFWERVKRFFRFKTK